MRSFTICNPHPILFGLSRERGEIVERMAQVGGRRGEHIGCLCGNLGENDVFEDLGIKGMLILKQLLKQ